MWAETKEVKVETEEKVVEFMKENLFYMFGYPREIFIDQGAQFTSQLIENIFRKHKIKHRNYIAYHP